MGTPLYIGTAGWSVPARYGEHVPPGGGSHLERYAQKLNAAEINSSFYRPHQRKTYERWAQCTPPHFRFAVKVPKAMTHEAKLAGGALLDRFVAEVTGLGDRLGALLVQLPPKSEFNERTADEFFRELRSRTDTPVALEPRHASWFTPEVNEWLAQRRIARVAADPVKNIGGDQTGGWSGLAYYRWHGSPRIYFSDYDEAALAALTTRLQAHRANDTSAWCIFDNTGGGAALGNALSLSRANALNASAAS